MEEVLLRNLLGGRTGVERRDNGVERHPRTGDTHDAVGVRVNWNSLNRFGRVHGKHSWFDYTAEAPSDRLRIRGLSGPLSRKRSLAISLSVLHAPRAPVRDLSNPQSPIPNPQSPIPNPYFFTSAIQFTTTVIGATRSPTRTLTRNR